MARAVDMAVDHTHRLGPTVHHGPVAVTAEAHHGRGSPVSSRYNAPGLGSKRGRHRRNVGTAANSTKASATVVRLTAMRAMAARIYRER